MISPRSCHASCTILSEDGSTDCIILIGGYTENKQLNESYGREYLNTTEILKIQEENWIEGPKLPDEMKVLGCVGLPPSSNYGCLVVGGRIKVDKDRSTTDQDLHFWPKATNLYGLEKSLTSWTFLGQLKLTEAEEFDYLYDNDGMPKDYVEGQILFPLS